jgi:ATP-dependent Zn protease
MKRTAKQLESIAHHEAGHAVMVITFNRALKSITIVPNSDTGALGECFDAKRPKWFQPEVYDDPRHERRLEEEVLILLAGLAAEHRIAGRNNWRGAGQDFHHAVDVASYRFSGDVLQKYLNYMTARTRSIVSGPMFWIQVQALSAALLEHRTLTGKPAREICRIALIDWARRPRGQE